jgi:hypothetical protein
MWKQTSGRKGQGGQGVLVCVECTKHSNTYPIKSPAAPELSLCEQAEADGWAYDIGFFAMLRGHTTVCPACKGVSHD